MKRNMGKADSAIRLVIAAIIGILIFAGKVEGKTAIISGIVAVVFMLTGFVSTCPLYLPFGINTKRNKQK